MTSSPGPTSKAINASSRASLPEAQLMAYRLSQMAAMDSSSRDTSGPCRKRPESTTRAMASKISPRNIALPRLTSSKGTEAGYVTAP